MNNDIIITEDLWLDMMVGPMIKKKSVGMVCGPLVTPVKYRQAGGWLKVSGLTQSYIKLNDSKKDCYLDFAHGGCLHNGFLPHFQYPGIHS